MTRSGERVVAMLNPPHLGEVIRSNSFAASAVIHSAEE